jgi:hypothetical protein
MKFQSVTIESILESSDDERRALLYMPFLVPMTYDLESGVTLYREEISEGPLATAIEFMLEATSLQVTGENDTGKDVKARLAQREKWANLAVTLQKILALGMGIAEVRLICFDYSTCFLPSPVLRLMRLPKCPSAVSRSHST